MEGGAPLEHRGLLKRRRGGEEDAGRRRAVADADCGDFLAAAFDEVRAVSGSPAWFTDPARAEAAQRQLALGAEAAGNPGELGHAQSSTPSLTVSAAECAERRERAARAAEQRAERFRDLRTLRRAGGPTRAGRLALDVLARRSQGEARQRAFAECLAGLRREFGTELVERVLGFFRAQVAAEEGAGVHDREPDAEVLRSALALERASELDAAVEGAVESSGVDAGATRWGRALARLPRFFYEGILGALHSEYQARAPAILASGWSQDWMQWDELVKDVHGFIGVGGEECLAEEYVLESVRRRLRAHVRLAVQNSHAEARSDADALAELQSRGLERGRGEIFSDSEGRPLNQCMPDSMLQLLMRHGFLRSDISRLERDAACAENRRRLAEGPVELRPTERCPFTGARVPGESPRAFLQHDVHAEPTVRFFMSWFAERGQQVRELPTAGIQLVVRSRFDSETLPPDRVLICVGDGSGEGGSACFEMYNVTGAGIVGTHYDPLFPIDVELE